MVSAITESWTQVKKQVLKNKAKITIFRTHFGVGL